MEVIFTFPGACGRTQCGRDHQQCNANCNRFAVEPTIEFPNNEKREFRILQDLSDRLVIIRNNFFTFGRLYQENRLRNDPPPVIAVPFADDLVYQAMAGAELFPQLDAAIIF